MNNNIILLTDSYKLSHAPQYPDMTEQIYSYFESRTGAQFKETVFFGLQYLLKRYMEGQVITEEKISQASDLVDKHVGPGVFNKAGWEYILKEHDGRLPILVRAVKEGLPVPESNVLMTVENTDPKCFWLTNLLETILVQIWYPSTVCSLSKAARQMMLRHLNKSGTPENVDFMLHDFGVRGSTSMESAAIGGLAHLVNFKGTDNIPALAMGREYYGCDMAGFSIPATEHSTITSHGQENELATYSRLLDIYPKGLFACVSDSWDFYEACRMWSGPLKEKVLARDGKLVVRPDSGDPLEVDRRGIQILGEGFGMDTNKKGYQVLNPKVGIIQGDGCILSMIDDVLTEIENYKLSADNMVFGMGGGLLQQVNRDTQRFAFKCSSITVNGVTKDVWKKPVTDNTKRSKGGKLSLIIDGYHLRTVKYAESGGAKDLLEPVFLNGEILREQTLDEIREITLKGIQ